MPLQNRVDPYGALFRTPARGTLMGNRGGAIHNEHREIVRPYKSRRWIACLLEFKGRSRRVMTPGLYTELFFLDEAVAFAAGHRPCAECRRERYNAFRAAWEHPGAYADEIDSVLHPARIDARRRKVTYSAPLHCLPEGTIVEIAGQPHLVWNQSLLLWTPAGYTAKTVASSDANVTVLTPAPFVDCFRRGYRPLVHPSALDV